MFVRYMAEYCNYLPKKSSRIESAAKSTWISDGFGAIQRKASNMRYINRKGILRIAVYAGCARCLFLLHCFGEVTN